MRRWELQGRQHPWKGPPWDQPASARGAGGKTKQSCFGCLVGKKIISPPSFFFFSASPPSSSPFSFPAVLQQLLGDRTRGRSSWCLSPTSPQTSHRCHLVCAEKLREISGLPCRWGDGAGALRWQGQPWVERTALGDSPGEDGSAKPCGGRREKTSLCS